jgi:membrane protein implicated in regulation of membrane protease activity
VAGFGVGGYFPALLGFGILLTMVSGVAGGAALAAIGYFVINIFYSRQSDSNINSAEYVGLTGIIVTSINGNSVGRVRCEIGTSRDTFLAKSADGSSVPVNSVVRITAMVGSTAVVEITDPTEIPGNTWRRQLQ